MREISLDKIKKNPSNPRNITPEKMDQLVQSIKEFPEMLRLRPIVVNDDMVILGGNMRLEACKRAGLTKVPYLKASDLTEEQQAEFIIKDNLGYGQWDWDMLANDWDLDQITDWGLDIPGLEPAPIDPSPPQEGEIQDVREIVTDLKRGDLIEIGPHRILCGDATNADDVAKLMKKQKADLAHNDPPYGMKKEIDGVLNDNLNLKDLLEFNREWIALQFTHIKDNGSWYCWGIDEPLMDIYCHILRPYIEKVKISFRNLITWDKVTGQGQLSELTRSFATADEKCLFIMMGKQDLVQNKAEFPDEWRPLLDYFNEERKRMKWTIQHCVKITGKTSASHYFTESQFQIPTAEHYKALQDASEGQAFQRPYSELEAGTNSIMEEIKKGRAYFDNTHDNMNNVWHFTRTNAEERETTGGHATPKPLAICSRVIKSSSPHGGLVVDYFLGSGSTMAAAHQLGRKCYGLELDPRYCQVTVDRLLSIDPSLKVKVNGKAKK